MITTTFKSTEQPWVLKWHPLLLTFFLVISRPTLWKMLHFNPTHGLSDVDVSLTNDGNIPGNTCADLYTKPTDKHQRLLYSSCHPLHSERAIPSRLALRLRRICSTDETFNTRAAQLTIQYVAQFSYGPSFRTKRTLLDYFRWLFQSSSTEEFQT